MRPRIAELVYSTNKEVKMSKSIEDKMVDKIMAIYNCTATAAWAKLQLRLKYRSVSSSTNLASC